MTKGTPKSLRQAIKNGFEDVGNNNPTVEEINLIAVSVKDYLAQKFTTEIINHEDVESILLDLFNKVMKE